MTLKTDEYYSENYAKYKYGQWKHHETLGQVRFLSLSIYKKHQSKSKAIDDNIDTGVKITEFDSDISWSWETSNFHFTEGEECEYRKEHL